MHELTLRAWLLVLLSAGLQILLFPMAGPASGVATYVSWVALVPWLVALLSPRGAQRLPSLRTATLLGYVCGIVWYAGNCSWIYQTMYLYGGLPKPVAGCILGLFALYLGLYHALFSCGVVLVARSRLGRGGALVLAPFLWVAVELARARITGFPWDLLGYSQVENLLLTRLAPVAGVMAISFVLAAANAALAAGFLIPGRLRWIAGCAGLAIAIVFEVGGMFQAEPVHESTDKFAVMLQENLEVGAPGRANVPLAQWQELTLFPTLSANPGLEHGMAKLLTLLPGMRPAVVIWPEAPSHLRSDQPGFRNAVGKMARMLDAPAIVGSLGVDFSDQAPKGYFLYDSASLFSRSGEYRGRYDKIHLVPWGEYIPFQRFFAFAHKLTEGAGDMDRGTRREIFAADGDRYGIFICYESIFGDEVREFVKDGARVLVNISDDGWYGDTGAPWQHLNMTRMRAIENGRWLLLDTNTGITTAIDPHGRMLAEAPRHVRGAFAFPFEFEEGMTFYTRHGDWFGWACVLVSLGAVAFAGFSSRFKKQAVL